MTDAKTNQPFWENFPNLTPGSLPERIGKTIPWHKDAASPRSSQTFCVSAFGSLIDSQARNSICRKLAMESLGWQDADGKWEVRLEFSDRSLLNEVIGTPSQLDVLLVGPDSAVSVESKFVSDAKSGLGSCSKFLNGDCKGYYGPGSDSKSPSTWCLLERWDGKRSPRLYWTLGRTYFQEQVFAKQNNEENCPFQGSNYQLMRNFLSAAAFAARKRRSNFGTIVICPKASSETVKAQVLAFQRDVLLPEYANQVAIVYYDDYLNLLRESGDEKLVSAAAFLQQRMDVETAGF